MELSRLRAAAAPNGCWCIIEGVSATETKPPAKSAFGSREANSKGGLASGETRRRKARGRHPLEITAELFKQDPEPIVKSVLAGGNAAAKVKLLELSFAWEQAQQRLAELEYEEIDRKTSRLDYLACDLMDDCEREERRKAELQAEVNELFNQRAELRAAIAAEAAEHDMEWVDDTEATDVA
jgi:hypothetical protein